MAPVSAYGARAVHQRRASPPTVRRRTRTRENGPEDLFAQHAGATGRSLPRACSPRTSRCGDRVAAGDDRGRLLRHREVAGVAIKRLLVDHRAGEVAEVAHVTHAHLLHHGHGPIAHLGPQRLRDVRAAGRRTLLSLVLERAAHHRHGEHLRIGARMRHDEVLAARLAHDARVAAVAPMLRPIVSHMLLKTPVEPVKCTPASDGSVSAMSEIATGSPGRKLMTPGGNPASSRSLHHVPRRQHRGGRRLPENRVAHERRCALGRLPPIAVKLNGVTAYTNPSSGR
jgi:hypothetical protein